MTKKLTALNRAEQFAAGLVIASKLDQGTGQIAAGYSFIRQVLQFDVNIPCLPEESQSVVGNEPIIKLTSYCLTNP
jgi:hypothetical protein